MSKILYKIFHSESDKDRDTLVKNAKMTLNLLGDELNSPTILINGPRSLRSFLENNEEFKANLDLKGYDPRKHYRPNKYDVVIDRLLCSSGIRSGWKYGEIGVWASNYLAWKSFLNTDADYLILVEDDAVFFNNSIELFHKYIKELPKDWEQFHLWAPENNYRLFNPETHSIGSAYICRPYQVWSNTGYVVTRAGATKLLENIAVRGINVPLDWYWFEEGKEFDLKGYTILPEKPKVCGIETSVTSTFQWQMRREDLTEYASKL